MYFKHLYFKPIALGPKNYDLILKLSINGVKVKQVDKIKFLGVIIVDKLKIYFDISYY